MRQRYERAAVLTGPNALARDCGSAVEGHWLDDGSYFFLREQGDGGGAPSRTPMLVEPAIGLAKPVIMPDHLGALLSAHLGRALGAEEMRDAEFDMPARHRLGVTVGRNHFLVDTVAVAVLETIERPQVPLLYAPDGRSGCFVRGYDLWIADANGNNERRLTSDGASGLAYGRESETNLNAVSERKAPQPLALWSADGQWLLTHQIDERAVPELALVENVPDGGGRPVLHRYRYACPGDPLPVATFVAIHVTTGRITRFDECLVPVLSYSPISSLRQMAWFGEDCAWALRVDRYGKQAELIRLDLGGGHRVVLAEEATSGYVEFHQSMLGAPNVRTLAGGREVVWWSERDGWGHLYLYDGATGALRNRITSGSWMVRDVVHVDEASRRIWFTASGLGEGRDPAWRCLCVSGLDGSGFQVLLDHDGDLSVPRPDAEGVARTRPYAASAVRPGFAPDGRRCVVRLASLGGNTTRIVDLDSCGGVDIAVSRLGPGERTPDRFAALAADGSTALHGVLFYPSDFDPDRQYPLVDIIYPGPQMAWAPQSHGSPWTALPKALAELGAVVMMLDTRSMPFRSKAIHQAGYGSLLEPQLADHEAVVHQLVERHAYLDRQRIGILGMSGGGAAAARALCEYGATFSVGVSVCGNHDSALYAAMWSDKYRGPADNWRDQPNRAVVEGLTGKLLLVSGDMDENVHVSQTLSLIDALIAANRDFDLLIVPKGGHVVLLTSPYVQRRVWDYFARHLFGVEPPDQFPLAFASADVQRWLRRYMVERRLWR